MIIQKRLSFRLAFRLVFHVLVVALLLMAATNSAHADAGGRLPIPELPSGISITIDDCSDSEWPPGSGDVLPVTITPIDGPSGSGKLIISHPDDPIIDEELYLFIEVDDPTTDVTAPNIDKLIFMFDLSHDHDVADTTSFASSDDRGIRFNRDGTVQRVYGLITDPTADPTAFPDDRKCISEFGENAWRIEAKILPSDLGLNSFNALMGAAILANDLNTGIVTQGRWPATSTAVPNTWTNLITRGPIDYVLLIDQSGSMAGDKWDSARQAGNNFALILSKLIDDELNTEFSTLGITGGGDRLGLATFTWSTTDDSAEVLPLAPIPSNPGDYTGGLPASPGGWTPIAGGINKTFEMFGGAANLEMPAFTNPNVMRSRVVMLLSDGKHNRPNSTIDFNNVEVDLDYLPTPNCLGNELDSLVRINTVAVGTDATVSTDKLDDIKDCFSGSRLTNIYNITSASEAQLTAQLTKFFVETLLPYYHWNLLTNSGADFTLNAGERKLLLFAFWASKGDAINGLSITKPDGTVESATVANGLCDDGLGYCYLFFDGPDEEGYTNFDAPGAVANGKFVLLDLRVEARFAIDNQPHGTNSTITLRARLREAGNPILGADVRVDVERPEEGFGTYVSTVTPDNCEPHPPGLPPIDPRLMRMLSDTRAGSVIGTTDPGAVAASQQAVDAPAPRFALMERLLKACGKDGLQRSEDSGLKLYDDGTHGDAIADDGLYILSFTNTQYEGSYVFRFAATGTTAAGQSLNRIKEIAEYIRIDVDPGHTQYGSRTVQQAQNLVVDEYFAVPRDRTGEYLGPGYAHQVKFDATKGQWVGEVRDYNNGIYSRMLRYDESKVRPLITLTVQGKQHPKSIRAFKAFEVVLPFAGGSFFDNALGLDDGVVLGARFGYRVTNRITLETEAAVTFTETSTGNSGNVVQGLANLRYYLRPLRTRKWNFYAIGGAGALLFRGTGVSDEAFTVHGGAGSVYKFNDSLGIQIEGRVFRTAAVLGAGPTTNFQATGGLVFWF